MGDIIDKLIEIVKEDSVKALGCTEPVAVAYCANFASKYVKGEDIEKITIQVSKNIFKNAKSVKIPGIKRTGLDLASAIGISRVGSIEAFMIFSDLEEDTLVKADKLLEDNKVSISYVDNFKDIYINVKIKTIENIVEVIVMDSHSKVSKVLYNNETIIDNTKKKNNISIENDSFSIKDMKLEEIMRIIENTDYKKLMFTLDGIKINMGAAKRQLKKQDNYLSSNLKKLRKNNIFGDDILAQIRILTAAAADMRMSGGECPIMTSGGSGNQGIGIIIPISIVAKHECIDDEKLCKSLFFAHCTNRYVKEYSGKLSGMCGCSIGAAIGATAGITWMLGGTYNQVIGACKNIYANLTGMICDGAKESCSLKLSTSAVEAVISSYLALENYITDDFVGIIDSTLENTILNIGKLSNEGFNMVDDVILEIISREGEL